MTKLRFFCQAGAGFLAGLACLVQLAAAQPNADYISVKPAPGGWELTSPHYRAILSENGYLQQIYAEGKIPILEEVVDGARGAYFLVQGKPPVLKVEKIQDHIWHAKSEQITVEYLFRPRDVVIRVRQTIGDDVPFRVAMNERTPMALIPGRDHAWRQAPIKADASATQFKFDTFQFAVQGLTSIWPSGNGIQICECATQKGEWHVINLEIDLFWKKESQSGAVFSVTAFPDSSEGVFAQGENPKIDIAIENPAEEPVLLVLAGETIPFDLRNSHHDQATSTVLVGGKATRRLVVALPSQEPGFYDFQFTLRPEKSADKEAESAIEPLPYTVAFGYNIDDIPDSQAPETPEDLRAFWDKTLAALMEVDPKYELRPVPERTTDALKAYILSFTTFGEKRYEAWLTIPTEAETKPYPSMIMFPGYGDAPYPFLGQFLPDEIMNHFVMVGLRINAKPIDAPSPEHIGYIQQGILDRDTFVYREIYASTVRTVKFLQQSKFVNKDQIFTLGGSQGGALALVAAALNPEVDGTVAFAPFVCDFPNAVRPEAIWPYDQVQEFLDKNPGKREQVFKTLSYYDVANLSKWITRPVLFGIGVQDKICPPESTIVAYHRIPAEKSLLLYGMFGHAFPERLVYELDDFAYSVIEKQKSGAAAPGK